MSRAFVLIKTERRHERHRATFMTDGETIQDNKVVMTTMKAIVFLISYTSALVIVIAFIFRFLVASEVDRIRLDLATNFVRKSEIIGTALYTAEQSAQNERLLRLERDIENVRRAFEEHDRKITTNTERLSKVEARR